MKKVSYPCVARSLIALLFVVAGIQKLTSFSEISSFIGTLGVPMPVIATLIVIIIEVPVAIMFAWGKKTRETGYTLIGFTVLATLLVHRNYFGSDLVNVLKNIAIIGGILGSLSCTCGTCAPCNKKCGCE